MRVDQERARAEAREGAYRSELSRCRKALARRTPPQPARDDRGAGKPWRPGDR